MARPRKTSDQSTTVSVSLRIDPRIKYGIDLAARIQKRTVTGVVEWAVERALADVTMPPSIFIEDEDPDAPTDLASHLDDLLWSPSEGVRLVLLASRYPSLLSYEESLIWETIKLSRPFWRKLPSGPAECTPWENARLDMVSEFWDVLVDIVQTKKEVSSVGYADLGLSEAYGTAIERASALSRSMYELSLMVIDSKKSSETRITEDERSVYLKQIESMQKEFDRLLAFLKEGQDS